MGRLNRREALPGGWESENKPFEFFEMQPGRRRQSQRAGVGELNADDAMVLGIEVSHTSPAAAARSTSSTVL